MAEEQLGQERTEQPTAKRLTEARKESVARSRELNTLLVMLTSALALWLLSGPAISGLTALFSDALSPTGDVLRQAELVPKHLMQVMLSAFLLISPFLAITVLAALAGQQSWVDSYSARMPLPSRRRSSIPSKAWDVFFHQGTD